MMKLEPDTHAATFIERGPHGKVRADRTVRNEGLERPRWICEHHPRSMQPCPLCDRYEVRVG